MHAVTMCWNFQNDHLVAVSISKFCADQVKVVCQSAGHDSRVESRSAHCAGGLPIKSQQPTSVTSVACREHDRLPCCIHAYTVYTPIGGKGRCRTRCDLQDHSMQARKSASKLSTLDLKPMRKDTQSPKQEQSVAPQNGPWSRQKI